MELFPLTMEGKGYIPKWKSTPFPTRSKSSEEFLRASFTKQLEENEEKPTFKITILKHFEKALERQIAEAVNIEMNKADIIMNSRNEWNGSKIPRIIRDQRNKMLFM